MPKELIYLGLLFIHEYLTKQILLNEIILFATHITGFSLGGLPNNEN